MIYVVLDNPEKMLERTSAAHLGYCFINPNLGTRWDAESFQGIKNSWISGYEGCLSAGFDLYGSTSCFCVVPVTVPTSTGNGNDC